MVPALPIERIASGAGADVDLLVGTNTEEQRLFVVRSGAPSIAPCAFVIHEVLPAILYRR